MKIVYTTLVAMLDFTYEMTLDKNGYLTSTDPCAMCCL